MNLKKCIFVKEEFVYLGFLVSSKGLKMAYSKECNKGRSFHGLASFYRKFITDFSSIFGPLFETMRGDRKEFKWIVGVDKSFNLLKQKVTKKPILALPDFNKVFQVDCDASSTTIGVVMNQEGRPVSYFSEKLNDAKGKYYVYDQEFYAIF